jgi:regulator of sigma E protease
MVLSILIFIIVLSILIVVHEGGHFLAAKRAGIWVEEFGLGLPPRIIGKKIKGTIYSLNLFPFGGFVRLHGENLDEGITKPSQAFLNKSKKVRMGVIVAGVVMNFILAVAAFVVVYSVSGIPRETEDVKIVDISASSPAQVAGLLVGDIVRTVDKNKVTSTQEFMDRIEEKKGKKVTLEVERSGEIKKISITPRLEPPEGEGPLGVTITNTEIYFPPFWQRPFIGVYYGVREALFWGKTVLFGFVDIFKELFAGRTPKDISGPVGIFAITSEAAKTGIYTLINFVGVLSVNLAILNIIPFPALDGGRLLFIVLEKIIGKRILPKVEATIHAVGMMILLILLLVITVSDVRRLIAAGSISGFLESVLK